MSDPNRVILNVPPSLDGNVLFDIRNPDVSDPAHAKLLGVTFANLIIAHANRDFVQSVFDELSVWNFVRKESETISGGH